MSFEMILRTSMLLLGAAATARVLRLAAPATRHLVWHVAIVAVLVAPMLTPLVPRFQVPLVPQVPQSASGAVPQVPQVLQVGASDMQGDSGIFGAVGTLGTLVTLVWFLLGWLASGWQVRRSRPAPAAWIAEARAIAARLGVPGSVDIRQARDEGSPHVAGLLQSVILLPPSASRWTPEDRRAALVHEFTHIRRGDRRTQALAHVACALHWFNPLVWRAAAGLAIERERACDAEVLRLGVRPSTYATLLLDIARATRARWTISAALSMARPAAMEGRLLAVLGDGSRAQRRATPWLVATGSALVVGAVLGAQPRGPSAPALADRTSMPPSSSARSVMPSLGLDHYAPTSSTTATLVAALGDARADVREKAALGLAFTPGADAIAPLLAALADADAQVREKAAIGLAFRRDPRVVEPLLAAIVDEDAQVREKAALALGASGDPRVVGALRRAVNDPDEQVREKAVAGLLLMGRRE